MKGTETGVAGGKKDMISCKHSSHYLVMVLRSRDAGRGAKCCRPSCRGEVWRKSHGTSEKGPGCGVGEV